MRLTAIPRITLGLVSLSLALLLVFDLLLNVFPREADTTGVLRTRVANSLSIQVAALVQANDWRSVERTLRAMQARDPDVASLGLRRADGLLVVEAGPHREHWRAGAGPDAAVVGILGGDRRWGQLEIGFRTVAQRSWTDWLFSGPTKLLLLFSLFASLIYFVYLRRMLHRLDPSAAVPERVRAAFDALSEGVLIVNAKEEILLVNQSFEAFVPEAERQGLVGRKASTLPWLAPSDAAHADARPWLAAMRGRTAVRGLRFEVRAGDKVAAHVVVNCSPLLEDAGGVRGCLITLDDVTALEQSHEQLLEVLADLASSKEQLELKNVELEELASRDSLSGCLNRRALFNGMQALFEAAPRERSELVCLLADIDHFKSINDRCGHGVGDEAIQRFAQVLKESVPRGALVGRYGGEEFCVAVPGIGIEQARALAETMRERVTQLRGIGQAAGHAVTMSASFGVSSLRQGARTVAELVNQADEAMYAAKQGGRNRVVVHGSEAHATAPAVGDAEELV